MASFRPRSFSEILLILWHRKLLVLFVAAVVSIAALIAILEVPRLYESQALVEVSGAIYDRNASGAQIAAVSQQMTSRSNLEALVTRLGIDDVNHRMDLRVRNLQDEIRFETRYRSDCLGIPESFTIRYRNRDPAIAQRVVADLVAIFDHANATLEKQAAEEADRIANEIADIESRMARAGQAVASSAARRNAAGRAAASAERARNERNAIAFSLEQLKDTQYSLHERYIALLRRQDALRQFRPSTAEPKTSFFQIVDVPSFAQVPAAPQRTKLMMIALLVALGTGVAVALALEVPRMARVHDARDVSYFLGVPTLAAIPESLTPIERNNARRRTAYRLMILIVIGAAAVPIIALLLSASRLFYIIGYNH
jgi:uncharacterized protein involved in exopolysaccharide biosynthesis